MPFNSTGYSRFTIGLGLRPKGASCTRLLVAHVLTKVLMKNPKEIMKKCLLSIVLTASLGGFAGCQTKGPMEEAGEKVDEAVKDTKRAVEDAVD
jgi:hypothetical protein